MTDLGPTLALEAEWASGRAAALLLDSLAADAVSRATQIGLIGAGVGATAVISPGTAMAVEATLGAATVGPLGLVATAARMQVTATAVQQALLALQGADAAARFGLPTLTEGVGVVVGGSVGAQAGRLALEAYAGTEGEVLISRSGAAIPTSPPARLSDLIRHLAEVNRLPDGTIGVLRLTGRDGVTRFVVSLPGTDSLDREAVRSWSSNASIRLDHPTAYEAGVRAAMQASGVGADNPVLLVGHSQGGMVAAEIARDPGAFRITQLVTAGSPFGDRPPPAQTGVIALENVADLVPTLDGAGLPQTPTQDTLRFSDGLGNPLTAHSLSSYVRGAETAETEGNPADLAGIEPFLQPTTGATATTWLLSRAAE